MANKSVYIVNMDYLLYLLLKRMPEEFERAGEEALSKSATDIEASAKLNAPRFSTKLASSIGHEVRSTFGEVTGIVGTNVEYAPYMEYGTGLLAEGTGGKGGRHWPPAAALDLWAKRKGIKGGGRAVAFFIGRRGGLKARKFMQRAFDAHKREVKPNVEAAFARALKRLGF